MKLTYHPHLQGGQQVLTFNLEFFDVIKAASADYSGSSMIVTPDAYDWAGRSIPGRATVYTTWKKWENLAPWFNYCRSRCEAEGLDFSKMHDRASG